LSFVLPGPSAAGGQRWVRASLEQWRVHRPFVSDETEDEVSLGLLGALRAFDSGRALRETNCISNKTSVSIVPTRKINRIITSNLRPPNIKYQSTPIRETNFRTLAS